ncbi:hypothetical protein B0H12DRAFT_469459 [Mycena haematopus]|nr:hypothetical protein B0H12DRAFT_469459 [Mycena haematopus]
MGTRRRCCTNSGNSTRRGERRRASSRRSMRCQPEYAHWVGARDKGGVSGVGVGFGLDGSSPVGTRRYRFGTEAQLGREALARRTVACGEQTGCSPRSSSADGPTVSQKERYGHSSTIHSCMVYGDGLISCIDRSLSLFSLPFHILTPPRNTLLVSPLIVHTDDYYLLFPPLDFSVLDIPVCLYSYYQLSCYTKSSSFCVECGALIAFSCHYVHT